MTLSILQDNMIIKDKRIVNPFSIHDERESLVVVYFSINTKENIYPRNSSTLFFSDGKGFYVVSLVDYEITDNSIPPDWIIKNK